MRTTWRSATLLALAALAPAPGRSASIALPPRLEVAFDRTEITVGDPVEVSVTWRLVGVDPASVTAALVGIEAAWGEALVLAPPVLERGGDAGDGRLAWKFRISAYRTGRVELPALEARIDGDPPRTVRSGQPLALEVRSVLPADPAQLAPAPPAAPHPLPLPPAFGWTAAAFALAIAAAALAWTRRTRAAGAQPAPAEPPLVELERALRSLDPDAAAAGHALLSRALRVYLGRRFEFRALDSTTTEIGRALAGRELEPAVARRAARLLGACDGVKFARRPASGGELAGRRDEALALGRDVELALAPPPAAPEAPQGAVR